MNDKDREERRQRRRYYFWLLSVAGALLIGIWEGTRGY
jgi:hypothetical protein